MNDDQATPPTPPNSPVVNRPSDDEEDRPSDEEEERVAQEAMWWFFALLPNGFGQEAQEIAWAIARAFRLGPAQVTVELFRLTIAYIQRIEENIEEDI